MLDVFSKTFLGVTVACARCHDHKFDAISQRDYYALAGYLQSSSYRLTRFETWEQDRKIAAELAALDAKYRPRIAAAVAKALRPRLDELAQTAGGRCRAIGETELGVAEVDLKGAKSIVDYADLPPGAWMTDGPTFGTEPVRPGQIRADGDAGSRRWKSPRTALPAAMRAWGDLGMAEPSENDPGRLGGWLRAGRTLKTPTFTLDERLRALLDRRRRPRVCRRRFARHDQWPAARRSCQRKPAATAICRRAGSRTTCRDTSAIACIWNSAPRRTRIFAC